MTDDELKYIRFVYKIIGPIRFVQKRVRDDSCEHEFYKSLGRSDKKCYADFDESIEDKSDIILPAVINEAYEGWYKYTHDATAREVSGLRKSYILEGYIAYLSPTLNLREARDALSEMFES